MSLCRDLLLAANGNSDKLTNQDRQTEIQALSQELSGPQILKLLEEMDHALELVDINANVRLLLENLMLSIPRTA